jgi:dimethylaniline monooxygenase (N-oxide forming)
MVRHQGIPNWPGSTLDYVLFTNYEAQIRSLVNGHIDAAWNGPIAHVMTEELAPGNVVSLGMRDVDRDFQSVVVVRKDANVTCLDDLKNRCLLTGSSDSPQAHVVPLHYLRNQITALGTITAFDCDAGKHGDTARGEIQALEVLSTTKQGDAALVSKMMWDRAVQGKITNLDSNWMQETCEELVNANIPTFDHCQLDAISTPDNWQKLNDFGEALHSMDWDIPEEQHLMKLEGIQKKWELPRQTGYDIVRNAMGLDVNRHRPATNFKFQKRSFSSTQSKSPQQRVAVVGAGVAGLQALRALKARGMDVTAFEGASAVGGLWKANYSNFSVQVPKQLYEFQDYPMTNVAWGDYATGEQVQVYTESFTDAFGLRNSIQFNTKVTAAQQTEDGKWKVQAQTKEGAANVLDFDYLVMATGLFSGANKHIPSIPGWEGFPGEIMHCDDFRDASVAKGKRVVVVGGGKSATDCAIEAYRAGASSVTSLQRTAHWRTPRKIAGLIPFQYIFLSRFGTALVSAHVGTFPGGSGKAVNAFRNSIIGPALMRPVFALVEELFALQFGLRGELRPKQDVVSDFYQVASVLNSDLNEAKKAGGVTVQIGEISEYGSDGTLRLKEDSSLLEADMVIFGTGFKQDYSIFSEAATHQNLDLQSDGVYLYRYIIPEKIQNLAFIGHMSAISNISTYGLQAEWLARNWTGGLVSGSTTCSETAPTSVKEEIETRKSWARSWMPESASRGMQVLLHQTHYHDQLLRDMGLNPHRKGNFVSEYLMPYEPADYDGIVGGQTTGSATSTKAPNEAIGGVSS